MASQSPQEEAGVPRLSGDELYEWALLIAACHHAQEALDRFGRLALTRRGFRPDVMSISNEGYIIVRRSMTDVREPRVQERVNGEGDPDR